MEEFKITKIFYYNHFTINIDTITPIKYYMILYKKKIVIILFVLEILIIN